MTEARESKLLHRQKQVTCVLRMLCARRIPEQLPVARTNQIVRVDPSQMPDEMEVVGAAPAVQTTLNAKITLRYGGMSVEMPVGMEITQIAVLMNALGQSC